MQPLGKQWQPNPIWMATASIALPTAPTVLFFALRGAHSLPAGFEQVGAAWVGGLYLWYPALIGVWFAAQMNGGRALSIGLGIGCAILLFSAGWTLYFYTCTSEFLSGFEDQLPAIIAGTVRNQLAEAAVAGCMLFPIAVMQGRSLRRDHSAAPPGKFTIWAIMGWTSWLAAILAIEGFPTTRYSATVWLAERTLLFCIVAGLALFLSCISNGRRWALMALPASVAAFVLGQVLWLGIMPTAFHWQFEAFAESELRNVPLVPPRFWLASVGQAAAFLTLLGLLYGCCKLSGMRYLGANAPRLR